MGCGASLPAHFAKEWTDAVKASVIEGTTVSDAIAGYRMSTGLSGAGAGDARLSVGSSASGGPSAGRAQGGVEMDSSLSQRISVGNLTEEERSSLQNRPRCPILGVYQLIPAEARSKFVNAPMVGYKFNALAWASSRGSLTTVRILVHECQVDVNLRDPEYRRSALIHAATNNCGNVVRFLLKEGNADAELPDKWGWTPLAHAIYHNATDSVRTLMECGVNVNARTTRAQHGFAKGMSCIEMARKTGHTQILELVQNPPVVSPLATLREEDEFDAEQDVEPELALRTPNPALDGLVQATVAADQVVLSEATSQVASTVVMPASSIDSGSVSDSVAVTAVSTIPETLVATDGDNLTADRASEAGSTYPVDHDTLSIADSVAVTGGGTSVNTANAPDENASVQ